MRHGRIVLSIAIWSLVAGCSLRPPTVETEKLAEKLTGERAAIVVVADGMPLDAVGAELSTLSQLQALRLALDTSPDIQAALARVRAAYAEAQQARLLPNPVLSVLVKFPTSGAAPTVEPGIAADLLSILKKPGDATIADQRLRAASADAVTVVLDVAEKVEVRYAEVQALEALRPVLQERQKLTARLLDIARARLRNGEGTRFDVTSLEAQSVELDVEIQETLLALREARLELSNLIGRPSGAAEWRVDALAEPAQLKGDAWPWVQAGLNHRPEIAARMWELSALGAEFKRAWWDILAGTEVGVAAEGTANSNADDWAMGPSLAVPIPIFDWGQAKSDLAGAKRSEVSHDLTRMRRQVVEEVRRAHAVFASSFENYQRVRGEWIPLLERRRDLAEAQYRAGAVDVESLILAHQELQSARAKQIELQKKTSVALTRLQRAAGGRGVSPIETNEVKP